MLKYQRQIEDSLTSEERRQELSSLLLLYKDIIRTKENTVIEIQKLLKRREVIFEKLETSELESYSRSRVNCEGTAYYRGKFQFAIW